MLIWQENLGFSYCALPRTLEQCPYFRRQRSGQQSTVGFNPTFELQHLWNLRKVLLPPLQSSNPAGFPCSGCHQHYRAPGGWCLFWVNKGRGKMEVFLQYLWALGVLFRMARARAPPPVILPLPVSSVWWQYVESRLVHTGGNNCQFAAVSKFCYCWLCRAFL